MSQSDYNIANADGATVRADINSQLDAIGSQNSGSTAPPVTFPYMRWFDTANNQLKERNGANTAWRVVAEVVDGELVPYSGGEPISDERYVRTGGDLKWLSMPVGMPFGIRDDLAGADVPPNDGADYRYIKLTASDNYNDGVLTSESVSGSSPSLTATAVIDYSESPLNGATVNLVNTERRFLRPGAAGVLQGFQIESHNHVVGFSTVALRTTGPTESSGTTRYVDSSGSYTTNNRGGDETRPRNIGINYYMRIA